MPQTPEQKDFVLNLWNRGELYGSIRARYLIHWKQQISYSSISNIVYRARHQEDPRARKRRYVSQAWASQKNGKGELVQSFHTDVTRQG